MLAPVLDPSLKQAAPAPHTSVSLNPHMLLFPIPLAAANLTDSGRDDSLALLEVACWKAKGAILEACVAPAAEEHLAAIQQQHIRRAIEVRRPAAHRL
jgi:hypothetical protein